MGLFDISHSQTRSTFFTFRSIPLPWLSFNILCSPLERALLFVSVPITTNNSKKQPTSISVDVDPTQDHPPRPRPFPFPHPLARLEPTSQDVLPAGRSVRSLPLPLLQARS